MIAAYFLLNGNEVTVVLMMVSFRVLYKIAHKRFTGKTPFAVGLPIYDTESDNKGETTDECQQ